MNTMRPEQNSCNFADNKHQCIFLNWTGNKPLHLPMLTNINDVMKLLCDTMYKDTSKTWENTKSNYSTCLVLATHCDRTYEW